MLPELHIGGGKGDFEVTGAIIIFVKSNTRALLSYFTSSTLGHLYKTPATDNTQAAHHQQRSTLFQLYTLPSGYGSWWIMHPLCFGRQLHISKNFKVYTKYIIRLVCESISGDNINYPGNRFFSRESEERFGVSRTVLLGLRKKQ